MAIVKVVVQPENFSRASGTKQIAALVQLPDSLLQKAENAEAEAGEIVEREILRISDQAILRYLEENRGKL